MKIAFITNYLPGMHAHAGGAEKAIVDTAALAAQAGNEVLFCTLPPDRSDRQSFAYPVEVLRSGESLLPFLRRYMEILKWYLWQYDPFSYWAARKAFKRLRPDIVHCGNFQFLTFSVLLAARHAHIPVVLSVYDYWYFCPLTTLFHAEGRICRSYHGTGCLQCLPKILRPVQWFFLAVRKWYFDRLLRRIHRFIVLSESSCSIVTAYGISADRIAVVPLPALETSPGKQDTPLPEQRKAGRTILFIGWLQKRKGLHVLLAALPIIEQRLPGVRVQAVVQQVKWEDDYARSIQKECAQLGRETVTLLTGHRERPEIQRLIAEADVIVIPEQWENMSPLLVIEAMLAGKAMVASRIGGIPEFIRNGVDGLLADPGNSADFAEQIVAVLQDPPAAARYGSSAAARVRELLNPEHLAQRLSKEYTQCKQR
jgi:glycosyltransferase involved in cell wall biosynthesis